MNRHQILTGAVNSGDSCYSVGSVEGVHFTAYAAGCDIVILASDFQRVQIIPGATHGNIQVKCVDCSSDTGKIAASYDRQVLIFEPTPLLHHTSAHKLDYQWYQTATLSCNDSVNALSWNLEGTRLLVGGSSIQLWQSPEDGDIHTATESSAHVGFTLGNADQEEPEWGCIWNCETASPIYYLRFSPDGLLFASASKSDRLVKVWYENKKSQMLRCNGYDDIDGEDTLDYSFCYIAHPEPVTDFSWRRISKYMPRGTVTNVLMTWCRDNICRLWSETVLPDDGLVDVQQFDLKMFQDPKMHATRHKNKFVHKLTHIRHAMHKRRKHKKEGRSQGMRVTALSTSESSHDFHKYWMQQNGLTPVLHFHLAASINPASADNYNTSDIPLNPSATSSLDNGFVVHWLNNKELQFTIESEKLMNDINNRATSSDETYHDDAESVATESSQPEKKKKHFWNRISSHSKISSIDSDSDLTSDHGGFGHGSQSAVSLDTWSQRTQSSIANGVHLEESPSTNSFLKMAIDDTFDRSIERMLKDWHSSADILFSIHPTDGSLLVWSIDFLDEIEPGCFRQAQVTFSSRLPHVFPVGDAMSMSANVLTYSANSPLDVLQGAAETATPTTNHTGQFNLLPHIYLLSKHLNGSLNLWKANFSESSKFKTCVSVTHTSRACGHRFRTNTASSHPVLPLLITTSHHNLPIRSNHFKPYAGDIPEEGNVQTPTSTKSRESSSTVSPSSELILWRVDSIGPLSLSGGLTELAKVNSPNIAAFDNVAWLPTLLPSSALGSSANSSSSLFVASDGVNMRLYQAVIDARGLLSSDNLQLLNRRDTLSPSSSTSSFKVTEGNDHFGGYNIVSEQSTSRPGCIIELEALRAAQHDWTNTQLLHVYQGQLVTGKEEQTHTDGAFVDLRNQESFEEKFYLVVLEHAADRNCSQLHMWEIIISSSAEGSKGEVRVEVSPNVEDGMESDTSSEPMFDHKSTGPQFRIDTNKVYGHRLHLPDGVDVLHATAAAGHLSSSTIYPACLAPYLFSTACSDGTVRFWSCRSFGRSFRWSEWIMPGLESSSLKVPGRPISVSCAFTGRMAVAYRRGEIMAAKDNPSNKYVNLYVSIYECESTGGSEWVQEDIIELKNIFIPDPKAEIDLSCILGTERKISHVLSSENFFKADHQMQLGSHHQPSYGHTSHPSPNPISPSSSLAKLPHVPSIPSLSTIQSVKKCIARTGNKTGVLQQKHLVQLDWAPTEDGSHILTVAVGSKVLFFSPISNEVAENADIGTSADLPSGGHPNRPVLQKSISMSVPTGKASSFSWLKLRSLELSTADGLPPLPMHVSWAKDGVLIVGMDNEMHVYSQWSGPQTYNDISGLNQISAPSNANLMSAASVVGLSDSNGSSKISTLRISQSVPHFHRMIASKLSTKSDPKDPLRRSNTMTKLDSVPPLVAMLEAKVGKECGLFEAVQITNPVLPQYHPKQLLELLNFGKVKRVKAILAHLMHCITNDTQASGLNEETQFRPRAMSVHQVAQSQGKVQVSEEMSSFLDISSIPPLPLYCLLAADNDQPISMVADSAAKAEKEGYNELFTDGYNPSHDDLDLRLSDDESDDGFEAARDPSSTSARSRFTFGPNESEMFSNALTHVSLPGLNNLDQMYLMALANTVANTQTDFADRFTDTKQSTAAMDDCGLRYVLAVGHDTYLMKTLSPALRLQFQKTGFSFSDIIWGFHSESEEEVVNCLPSFSKGEPTWEEARMFGVGWVVTNINVLRRTVEKIAKASFQKTKDPMDSAIFYLAMKKKMILWGLYRSVSNEKMQKFFKNDFNQERWRKAALKNAYQLLGLQRFLHAAAFFLLAGKLKDAVDICINKLDDLQLAIVVSKLYASDLMESGLAAEVKDILDEEILGGKEHDEDKCHPDPFVRSMAYWMGRQYKKSLSTLLTRNIGIAHPAYRRYINQDNVSVFNFYNYLRTHPLLLRQKLANQADNKGMKAAAVLSGFSHATTDSDKVLSVTERISPAERSLYFLTAHEHFKTGCPALALEVLTKLPQMADMSRDEDSDDEGDSKTTSDPNLANGNADSNSIDWGAPVASQTANSMDWGAPVASQTANSMDWGAPVASQTANSMDWGAPTTTVDWGAPSTGPFSHFGGMKEEEPPSFSVLSSDESSDSSDEGGLVMKKIGVTSDSDTEVEVETPKKAIRPTNLLSPPVDHTLLSSPPRSEEEEEQPKVVFDIMAQQLKFIACLKVAMEELATLATGFEVEGGQLRYQLYIWLEKQTEVLERLCNYCGTLDKMDAEPVRRPSLAPSFTEVDRLSVGDELTGKSSSATSTPLLGQRANLHEVITADRLDFEAKQQRMARRKQWLKRNQQLLRTLLTYCSLYGASGGGLACIKMELILLLQELQQDRTQKQLLSPLPFPTTLPLLSASIASSKTVIVDPISYLQSFVREMLCTILSVQNVPDYKGNLHLVVTLRNLSTALSSCIYECLCDSDSIVIGKVDNDVGLEGFTNISTSVVYKDSCLMAGARSKQHTQHHRDDEFPQTAPSKWPGATQLTSMLMRERDSDAPKLPLLLCESLFSVYLSVLIHALTFYETNVLYRLVAHEFDERMWSTLFGGGVKTLVKARANSLSESAVLPPAPEVDKHRAKLMRKVVQGPTSSPAPARPPNKPTYQEKFVPPKMSMMNYLFSKPVKTQASCGIDYDSDDNEEDEEVTTGYDRDEDEDFVENEEHMDPHSYSWCLMRLAVVKHVLYSLNRFLALIGFETADLPSCSPLLHSLLRNLECWENQMVADMDKMDGAPADYIPGLIKDPTASGPSVNKYRSMLSPGNTPFRSSQHSALPCRRLWFYLVNQPHLHLLFIKYLFGKKRKFFGGGGEMYDQNKFEVKVVHKDQEPVNAFCLNSNTETKVSVATHREMVELDITTLLNPPVWVEDDSDGDEIDEGKGNDFVYIPDRRVESTSSMAASSTSLATTQTGRGTYVTMRQQFPDVRKMGVHPMLPYYLAGSGDGTVRIYEFGHSQPLQEPIVAGTAPRPTRIQFNAQGNKFGVTDMEGNLSLFQVGFGTNTTTSYLRMPCHNKSANDFAFIGSSSFLATAGHSSDGKNVEMWDTLLPPRCSLIKSFHCHEYGGMALLYAPQHQLLVAGGKKGDVCIFDVRQRKQLHTFMVHESSVRCMALDPCEEFFVTGSADGDVKVWGLSMHQLIKTYPGEHSKASMFSRTPTTGVLQLHVTNDGHLFSAGADGTLKVRLIPDENHSTPSTSFHEFANAQANKSVTFSLS